VRRPLTETAEFHRSITTAITAISSHRSHGSAQKHNPITVLLYILFYIKTTVRFYNLFFNHSDNSDLTATTTFNENLCGETHTEGNLSALSDSAFKPIPKVSAVFAPMPKASRCALSVLPL